MPVDRFLSVGRVAAVAALTLLAALAHAQSARPGMRVTVTRVAPTGGFTAHGFLVVHATSVTRTAAPACGPGTIAIVAEGHEAHGRIRRFALSTYARPEPADFPLGEQACASRVEVTLDDGTVLHASRGSVHAQLVGASGLDATLEASSIDASGVPTTIAGHIVLSSSP